jgi:hypothetical protein
VTQGIVDVTDETWNADARELSATSQVVADDPYELRIAGLRDGGAWKPAAVAVSEADKAAGVTIGLKPPAPGDEGWLRVVIASRQSGKVRWLVKFESAAKP